MTVLFDIAALIAVASTVLVITGKNAIHALLCLILSLLSIAVVFFLLGAPFAALLEVIIYAGAIMVLFVFVIMMLNLGRQSAAEERASMKLSLWIAPSLLALILLGEILYVILSVRTETVGLAAIGPREVGLSLFGPYLLAVEAASVLLLSGLMGAYHLGKDPSRAFTQPLQNEHKGGTP